MTSRITTSGTFVAPSRTTLAEFVEPWLDGLANQGRKPTTLQGYRRVMERDVLPVLGSVALQDLRASDLDALYASLSKRGLSMASVHHVHAAVNNPLRDAERKGPVNRNVARLANAPSLTTARSRGPEMTVWSPAGLAGFLASIEGNRNEALFRLMAMTGLRRSEVVGLRWSDVSLDRSRLTVNQAATVVDGDEAVDAPKTRRSRRVIDLDPATTALLQRHRASQRELFLRLGVTAHASDRVFTNEIGDPIRPNSIGQAFTRLVKVAGVPPIRLHDLRHTHASHLLMAGINVKVVSERLGHASVSFTLDTYAHVMPGQQAEAACGGCSTARRAMTVRHGFIDESIRTDGWYRLTVVEVAARDLGAVTRSLRSMVPKGRQRLHFSSEGEAQRRQILKRMVELPVSGTTIAAPYRRGRDEEPARERCIEALVAGLDAEVALLVLDSRGAERDRRDRRVIRDALRRLGNDDGLTYTHRGSSDEPLLALPDALGWSVGAGGYFAKIVADRVRQMFLPEKQVDLCERRGDNWHVRATRRGK